MSCGVVLDEVGSDIVCEYSVRTYELCSIFFFQAEDGIRDAQESRGLGDVYKRQVLQRTKPRVQRRIDADVLTIIKGAGIVGKYVAPELSLIHI